MLRKAVVSGTFYPKKSDDLEQFIKRSLPKGLKQEKVKAAILPHAGYVYSGAVAVETVARIKPRELVVVLGPNHTGKGLPFSVYPQDRWQTPLGDINIEVKVAGDLVKKGVLQGDTQAHMGEHSIEVELPILKHFFKDFKLVPIVCVTATLALYAKIAKLIYDGLNDNQMLNETLIVASSDMTHYEPHKDAIKKDKYVLEAILNLDSKEFLRRIEEKDVSMCGVAPVGIMLELLKLMGAGKSELIKYSTSGEITKDYSSVVGYAGVIFN